MESIIVEGETKQLASEPLRPYQVTRADVTFLGGSTACMRGYQGTWEIRNQHLLLLKLSGKMRIGETYFCSYGKINDPTLIDILFSQPAPIFAGWYSGELRIPMGEQLYYVHRGHGSIHEKDKYIEIENGVVISEREVCNQERVKALLQDDLDLSGFLDLARRNNK